MEKHDELISDTAFAGLGKALRWMREKKNQKQYQIAESAGITKAMLSAYETGKQRPTLDTLEKILSALQSDLGDLFDTLQVVNERPLSMRYRAGGQERPGFAEPIRLDEFGTPSVDIDVRRILGGDNIQPAEEEAVAQMIRGYFRWLRTLRDRAVQ